MSRGHMLDLCMWGGGGDGERPMGCRPTLHSQKNKYFLGFVDFVDFFFFFGGGGGGGGEVIPKLD